MSTTASSSKKTTLKLNLTEVIDDIFMVLSEKERAVVVRRFSLDNKQRQTLESIGQSFNVTRERIRQIEKIALGKLKRTVTSTKLRFVPEIAEAILKENGGVMLEENLIAKILETLENSVEVDWHIIRLALTISPNIANLEKTNQISSSWHLNELPSKFIIETLDIAVKELKTNKDVIDHNTLHQSLKKLKPVSDYNLADSYYPSALSIDMRIKGVEEGYGLMTWRHINPKSIRDKSYIVLKKIKKPLHFVEIAKLIEESSFDKKQVTVQAVHNELIRYPQFVLVGRGLYALKEWGYQDGTVADIIEALLKKKSPLSKQEITKGVLKQRQVKKGTISLNLQKNPHFVRVGRAVYALDESKKV